MLLYDLALDILVKYKTDLMLILPFVYHNSIAMNREYLDDMTRFREIWVLVRYLNTFDTFQADPK